MKRGLAVISAAAVVLLLLNTHSSAYSGDDFQNFGQARDLGLSWTYLKLGIYQHFAPGHRLLDWTIMRWTDLGWWLALLYSSIGVVAAIWAFGILVRDITGSVRLALGAAAFFGLSVAWIRVVQWWANAAHVVPSLVGVLVCLIGVVRYRRDRSRRALALAAVGYIGGLLFYSKTLLVVAYAVLLLYVALPSAPDRLRAFPALVRRDLPLLVALVAITVGYVVILKTGHYDEGSPLAPLSQWNPYLRIVWLRNVAPLTLNSAIPPAAGSLDDALVVLAEAIFATVVVVTLWRTTRAWRAWAMFGLAVLTSAVLIGVGRLALFGPGIGYDLRYTAETAFLLPLAFCIAWAMPARRSLPAVGHRPQLAIGALVAAVAVFVGLGYRSGDTLASSWEGPTLGRFIHHLQASVTRQSAAGAVTVLEGNPPPGLLPPFIVEYGRFSNLVALATDGISVDGPSGTPLVIDPDGTARPWISDRTRMHTSRQLVRTGLLVPISPPKAPPGRGEVCTDARQASTQMDLDVKAISPPDGRPKVIAIGLDRTRVGAKVGLYLDRGAGFVAVPERMSGFRVGQRLVRMAIPPDVVKVRIEAQTPAVTCIPYISLTPYA
jgi:hypothetical protein